MYVQRDSKAETIEQSQGECATQAGRRARLFNTLGIAVPAELTR